MGIERTKFPGGTYRITAARNAELCAAVGTQPSADGRAHPIFYYVATQVGMGMAVAELLAICDFDIADGPMMTRSSATFAGDLKVDVDYSITGEIVSLTRKPSRTFGYADLLRFRLTATDPSGCTTAECVNEWILPRGPGGTS